MNENSVINKQPIDLYLSKETTQACKGLFAVGVLIHHLYQYSHIITGPLGMIFQALGYLSVSMFFFYSGYGLMISSQKRDYIKKMPKQRILPLYLFYAVLIIIYTVYQLVLRVDLSIAEIIQSFIFGKTIVPLAWYIQVILLLYLVYWVVFKAVPRDNARCFAIWTLLILYCIVCKYIGLASTWYESIMCFGLGMLWVLKKDQIDKVLLKHGYLCTIISFICFGTTCTASLSVGIILKMLSTLFFASFMLSFVFCPKHRALIENQIAHKLGKYSFAIYVSQGFFLILRKNAVIYIENPYVFIGVTIIGTLVISLLINNLYIKIMDKFRWA